MGIAHGFASAVILRAEGPVHAGAFRQSAAFLGRAFSPQSSGGMRFLGRCPRLVSRRAVGPEEYAQGKTARWRLLIPQDPSEWTVLGAKKTGLGRMKIRGVTFCNRHITHAQMHGGVAEPGEEEHSPEPDLEFAFLRHPGPDFGKLQGCRSHVSARLQPGTEADDDGG